MRIGLSRCVGLTTLAACVAVFGCKSKDTAATTDSTAAMGTTTGAMSDTSAMAGAAKASDSTAAGGAMSDANIAALVDEVNVADSTLAAAALPKLTSTGAKNFAKLMMGEHHAAHVQGLQVEKAQNITPQLPANDPFKGAVADEQSALSSMSKGAAYDSTYIAHEAGIHQAVLDWAGKNTPQNAVYQKYMQTVGSVVQKHLRDAQDLEKKMSGSKT